MKSMSELSSLTLETTHDRYKFLLTTQVQQRGGSWNS